MNHMNRKCPRTLDKPILLFGLELEDLAALLIFGGGGCLFIGPVIPGIGTIIGWVMLLRFKQDKPQGYLLHWLYAQGFELPGLIPPLSKVKYYGVYGTNNFPQFQVR
jgi:hypothetical protein